MSAAGGADGNVHVVVHPSEAVLAAAVAGRLLAALADAQATRGSASVVLTGGGIGVEVLRQVAVSAARDAVDWARVDVWWGDERFVASDDPDRNDRQAREALLSAVGVDPTRVHPVAALGELASPEEAAGAYASAYAAADPPDVLLLGLGPEGHVGSIFPDSPAVHETTLLAVGVHDCPKPPPTRVTLTLPAMARAGEAWLLVSGSGKADAVARALGGAAAVDLPAAGVTPRGAVRWLIDTEAASRLP